mmetsp:Transcript_2070/g.3173  ORF Transcript_2070/g.3173 Transcript_2070/m.3173 type:complete len:252 (+) Transcript_2070:92-847(+)
MTLFTRLPEVNRFPRRAVFNSISLLILLAGLECSVGMLRNFATRSRHFRVFQTVQMIPSNEELVGQRLEVARAKKEARLQSIKLSRERNLQLKRLFHDSAMNSTSGNNYTVPNMYAVKVSVCKELRQDLKLNGREKRGRFFVEVGSKGSQTLKGLQMELHAFFRALRKSTYRLEATLPILDKEGSLVLASFDDWNNVESWNIDGDDDVLKTFQAAELFYENKKRKNETSFPFSEGFERSKRSRSSTTPTIP